MIKVLYLEMKYVLQQKPILRSKARRNLKATFWTMIKHSQTYSVCKRKKKELIFFRFTDTFLWLLMKGFNRSRQTEIAMKETLH